MPLNTYDQSKFKNDNGLVTYDDANASLGIDVSDYQGDIDWAAVKASGIDFAMIRAGYRGATRGKLNEDSKFADNYTGAKDAGVKVGIYFFSQATSVTEAEEEAGYVLQLLQNKSVDYPVVFDWEQMPRASRSRVMLRRSARKSRKRATPQVCTSTAVLAITIMT